MEKILIVGQGIAGTMLSFALEQEGINHSVIDDTHKGASSLRAAGVVNPITGRRFVKSWEFDQFYTEAKKQYAELEKFLGGTYWDDRQTAMLFNQIKQINDWTMRSGQEDLKPFVVENFEIQSFQQGFNNILGAAIFKNAAKVNLHAILSDYAQYLRQHNRLIEEAFVHKDLEQNQDNSWTYRGEKWDKIIFCEGHRAAKENPFFPDLPFNLAKGEALLLRIPQFPDPKTMIKASNLYFVNIGQDIYWVGSSYIWDFEDENPTQEEKQRLLAEVRKNLLLPFELVEHGAGIRPTTKDRRPRLWKHKNLQGLYIFNGLGTKGSYLAPLLAKEMLRIVKGLPPLFLKTN